MFLAVNNLKDYSYLCKLKKRRQMNQDIRKLVEKYEADRNMYLTDRYNETLVRSDFLDPLFELLGWDIKNKAGRPTNEREVLLRILRSLTIRSACLLSANSSSKQRSRVFISTMLMHLRVRLADMDILPT